MHNCQNYSQKTLNYIESILIENSSHSNLNLTFRCWISFRQHNILQKNMTDAVWSSLEDDSIRAFLGSPLTMKECMVRSLSWIDSDLIKSSTKPEWPVLLHNLCFFHSCLRLRTRYSRCGWNSPLTLNFATEEFLVNFKSFLDSFKENLINESLI